MAIDKEIKKDEKVINLSDKKEKDQIKEDETIKKISHRKKNRKIHIFNIYITREKLMEFLYHM